MQPNTLASSNAGLVFQVTIERDWTGVCEPACPVKGDGTAQ